MEKAKKSNKKTAKIIIVIICALIVLSALGYTVIIPFYKYSCAMSLLKNGQYTEAIPAFSELDGFWKSEEMINECNYCIATSLMGEGKYIAASEYFSNLQGYKDSEAKLLECEENFNEEKYINAVALMEQGLYEDALASFKELNGYKDSDAKRADIKLSLINDVKIGDYIRLGAYEQDNNLENGKEDIEWLVLSKQGEKALVISKYALECMEFTYPYAEDTWETCTLRKWLNEDFVNIAFLDNEKAVIPTVTVEAGTSPESCISAGNATEDKVFLLSILEAREYFDTDTSRQCAPTEYVIEKGADVNTRTGNCRWWLRSPGLEPDCIVFVYGHGEIDFYGSSNVTSTYAVRPAMWIDLTELS